MSVCLLLTAVIAGGNPIPPPGWPAYPVPAYAGGYMPYPQGYGAYYGPPMPPPPPNFYFQQAVQQQQYQQAVQQQYRPAMPVAPVAGYATTVADPMPQYTTPIMATGGCANGNCGGGGGASGHCGSSYMSMDAPCCETKRHRLFHRFRKHDCCSECDDCCEKGGLLSRLRNCFKRKHDCCAPQECNTCAKPTCCEPQECCKPSLRDRLKKCFHKNDCCEDSCKPSLHDRLRAFFHRCKKQDDCCDSHGGCGSAGGCTTCQAPPMIMPPANGNPEKIKEPKELKEDPDARLPNGPPVHMIKDVPF